MNTVCVQLAAAIVARSGPRHPADAVLRETLRQQRGLSASHAREVARLVFGWFRWCGWLEPTDGMERQFLEADALATRFRESPATFSEDELALAVPDWIREEMEVSSGWLRSLQGEPRLWLRAKQGQATTLAQRLGGCRISDEFPDAVEYLGREDLFRSAEFHAGEFELQDIASQAVGLLCSPQPGEKWWDACAGEGGKTLHLSELMKNRGLIWASDRAMWRLQKLRLRAARAHCFNYRFAVWCGAPKLPTRTTFDGVLVDAPCSGVGTWQRNPHARWELTPSDVCSLAEIQKRLLSNASAAVKPGGKLIYAVCTLTHVETVKVVEAFGQRHQDFIPLCFELGGRQSHGGTMFLWPQELGGNGMFIGAWQRNRPSPSD